MKTTILRYKNDYYYLLPNTKSDFDDKINALKNGINIDPHDIEEIYNFYILLDIMKGNNKYCSKMDKIKYAEYLRKIDNLYDQDNNSDFVWPFYIKGKDFINEHTIPETNS